jgi:hypothetical protein
MFCWELRRSRRRSNENCGAFAMFLFTCMALLALLPSAVIGNDSYDNDTGQDFKEHDDIDVMWGR